ncbi:MAG TPA: HepT-like ribonuclease domain-containing protein [Longimicrobium sp.]|nr:HepT-like ribonuclease domain-containing protein [Longimicrobium sp.]
MLVFYSEFAHHSINLLALVYPLTEDEYRTRSLERRASYAYLTDLTEGASRLVSEMFDVLQMPKPKSYREKFEQAENLKLLPRALVESLQQIKTLRNNVVHENPRIDASLELYHVIGKLCTVGFALFEVYVALYKSREADCGPEPAVIDVDKAYLLNALHHPYRYRTRNPHSPSWEVADIPRALSKLQEDASIPTFAIDQPQIVAVLRKIR